MTFKINLKKSFFHLSPFCFYFCPHVTQSHSLEVPITFVSLSIFLLLYIRCDRLFRRFISIKFCRDFYLVQFLGFFLFSCLSSPL